jgi:hypothetical protein
MATPAEISCIVGTIKNTSANPIRTIIKRRFLYFGLKEENYKVVPCKQRFSIKGYS